MKCVSCKKEVDEICPDEFCRNCHVSISFEDCCDETWLAEQNLKKGRSIEETKQLYPNARCYPPLI